MKCAIVIGILYSITRLQKRPLYLHIVFYFVEMKLSRRSKPVPCSIPECLQLLKEPPHDICNKSHTFPLLWPPIKSLKVKATVKGKYVTCYICQVGALSKAEGILEWNMGLILTTARILFQRKISRCEYKHCRSKLKQFLETS